MVIALDDDTKSNAESFGLPAFRMDVKVWGDGSCGGSGVTTVGCLWVCVRL